MVIGNKDRFALEYEIREYYDSDFIGDGKFLVHIAGVSFGQNRNDATTFSGIVPRLGRRAERFVISNSELCHIEVDRLARRFYENGYSDNNTEKLTEEQIANFQGAIEKCDANWSAMDEAFDDGSFVLQINMPQEEVKLIGFRPATYSPGAIGEIRSTRVAYSEFSEVILSFIDSLKSDFVKKYGHGEELPVFNWWRAARR